MTMTIPIAAILASSPDERQRRSALQRLRSTHGAREDIGASVSGIVARMAWVQREFGEATAKLTESLLLAADMMLHNWRHQKGDSPELERLIPWIGRELRNAARRGDDPWAALMGVARLPSVEVHRLNTVVVSVTSTSDRNGLSDLMDWYREVRPRVDILRMSMAEALAASEAWHDRFVVSMEGAPRPGEAVFRVHEYPGWTVQRLTTRKQLEDEGKTLGHCIGGRHYYDQSRKGLIELYSLRDPDGKAWASWEIVVNRNGSKTIKQLKSKNNDSLVSVEMGTLEERRVARDVAWEFSTSPLIGHQGHLPDGIMLLDPDRKEELERSDDKQSMTEELEARIACPLCGGAPDQYANPGFEYYRIQVNDGRIDVWNSEFDSNDDEGPHLTCYACRHDYWPGAEFDFYDVADFN